jgi:hypothetical protein
MLIIITAAVALALILAPAAHGDPNSDFIECLTNHGIDVKNPDAILDVGRRIQNDLKNGLPAAEIEHNLVYNFDIQPSIAKVDVECAGAALLMDSPPS